MSAAKYEDRVVHERDTSTRHLKSNVLIRHCNRQVDATYPDKTNADDGNVPVAVQMRNNGWVVKQTLTRAVEKASVPTWQRLCRTRSHRVSGKKQLHTYPGFSNPEGFAILKQPKDETFGA